MFFLNIVNDDMIGDTGTFRILSVKKCKDYSIHLDMVASAIAMLHHPVMVFMGPSSSNDWNHESHDQQD